MSAILPVVPHWLDSSPVEYRPSKTPPQSRRDLQFQQVEFAFDTLLEAIAGGATLDNALKDYPVPLDLGLFRQWLGRNPERQIDMEQAESYRAEVWAGQIIAIADGTEAPLEDVNRSKLRIDTRWRLMSAHNRKRYGEVKTRDINNTISITAALEQSRARAFNPDPLLDAIEDAAYTEVTSTTTREKDDGGTGE